MAIKRSEHKIILSAEDRTKVAVLQAEERVASYKRQLNDTERSLKKAFDPRVVAAFVGAVGFTALVGQTTQLGDAYTKINEKINLGNRTIDESSANEQKLIEVRTKLLKISNETFSSLDSNAAAYNKLSFAVQRLGKDSDDTLGIISFVNKTLQINAATTQEATAARLQFAQALASDRLGGDEYRSLTENAPRLIKAIADGLNISIGKLKELSKQGALTTEKVLGAASSQMSVVDDEFSGLALTIDRAQERWKNNLTEFIGQANEGIGINTLLAQSINLAANNIDLLATGVGILSAVMAGKLIGSLSNYIVMQKTLSGLTIKQVLVNKQAAASELATAKARQAHAAMLLKEAQASVAATTGLARLTAITTTLIPAQNALTASTTAVTAAQARYTVAAGAASLASRGLGAAMGLLGGPAGVAIIAGAGLFYLRNKAEQAKTMIELSSGVLVTHADILGQVEQAVYDFANANLYEQGVIKKGIQVKLADAKASLAQAQARQKSAAASRDSAFKQVASSTPKFQGGFLGGTTDSELTSIGKKASDDFNKESANIAAFENTVKRIEESLNNLGKPVEKVKTTIDGVTESQKKLVDELTRSVSPLIEYNEKIKLYDKLVEKSGLKEEAATKLKAKARQELERAQKALTGSTKAKKASVDQDERAAKAALAAASPQAKYNQEIEKFNRLRKKGELTEKEYAIVKAKADRDLAESLKVKKKALTEEERYNKQLEEEAKRLNLLNDPLAAYKDALRRIEELKSTGILTEKAYNQEREKAKKILSETLTEEQKHTKELVEQAKALNLAHNPLTQYNESLKKLNEINKTGKLDSKAFNEELKNIKKTFEESNQFIVEQNRLLAERDLIGKNPIEQYRTTLEDSGKYSPGEIDQLASDAQLNAFQKAKDEIIAQGIEAGKTEAAFIRYRLELEGLTPAQVEYAAQLVETNNRMQEARGLNESFAQALETDISNALEGGKLSFQNFADAIISEIYRMYALKPLLDALFGDKTKDGGREGGGLLAQVIGGIFGFAKGGVMTPNGAIPLKAYASGGIANSPQLALFGEGRLPEAYVPLPDGKSIPVTVNERGSSTSNITNNVIIHNAPSGTETKKERNSSGGTDTHVLLKQIESGLAKNVNNGDSPLIGALGKKLKY